MSNDKKQKNQTVEQELSEKNAKLESEIRSLKSKIDQTKNSTEMAKMQAQINVLASQQDRSIRLENEYRDRKAKYNKNVAKRKAKDDAKAQAIEDIENDVVKEPTPSAKTSEQSTQEAKDFHKREETGESVPTSDPGQSLRSAGQGEGPSVVEDSKTSTVESSTGNASESDSNA